MIYYFLKKLSLSLLISMILLSGCIGISGIGTKELPELNTDEKKEESYPEHINSHIKELTLEEKETFFSEIIQQLHGDNRFAPNDSFMMDFFDHQQEEEGTRVYRYQVAFCDGTAIWRKSRHNDAITYLRNNVPHYWITEEYDNIDNFWDNIEYWFGGRYYTFDGKEWRSKRKNYRSLENNTCDEFLLGLVNVLSAPETIGESTCSWFEHSYPTDPDSNEYNYDLDIPSGVTQKNNPRKELGEIKGVEFITNAQNVLRSIVIYYSSGATVDLCYLSKGSRLVYYFCDHWMNRDMGSASPLAKK